MISDDFPKPSPLRDAIRQAYRMDEAQCVAHLLSHTPLSNDDITHIQKHARKMVTQIRARRLNKGGIDAFLFQYDLSSEEGIALMCLAEAMLRIPDSETAQSLIREKLNQADWSAHLGKSEHMFVNAATWGLMMTGKVMSHQKTNSKHLRSVLSRALKRGGAAMAEQAMKIMSHQFVMGRNIKHAIQRAKPEEKKGFRYSYDMLGEAARTAEDAQKYFQAYQTAITHVGTSAQGLGPIEGPGVSVKLSALLARYEVAKQQRVIKELLPKLKQLCLQAKQYNIGLNIDAEEADRLDLSLDLLDALLHDEDLAGWDGLGWVIQTYQKRAWWVLDWLITTLQKTGRKMLVRLVKGAYWDYEIKEAQMLGLKGYPVFTRKVATDVSYLVCADKLLSAGDCVFPQFATHNAYTVAAVMALLKDRKDFEFQCLHGMGAAMYEPLIGELPCRVYAPVGEHEDLLAYLVRRLLENGANTSFVNRIIDDQSPIEALIADPFAKLKALEYKPHPNIPLPADIFGPARKNSQGIDLSDRATLKQLAKTMQSALDQTWFAAPRINGDAQLSQAPTEVMNPSNTAEVVGHLHEATQEQVQLAMDSAAIAFESWSNTPVAHRADCLDTASELLTTHMPTLMALAVREAGKTLDDAVAEVREAIDFCRYYAEQARTHLAQPLRMPGYTGEVNELSLHGRGVIVAISPWNFPLAIFIGQVTAALAAGNTVVAKPANQTGLIADYAVRLLHQAGIPKEALHLTPGSSRVTGPVLLSHPATRGVMLTGSTTTAKTIAQQLAERPGVIVPLIAETGGQNAMIVDSSALPEQVVQDIMQSAFGSAGQRCSALRVLFLQTDVADKMLTMLKGAMAEWTVGDPSQLSTDIGPLIDAPSKKHLLNHRAEMEKIGQLIAEIPLPEPLKQSGHYVAPCAFEIAQLSQLEAEVFGPFLHVIRYRAEDIDDVIQQINDTGYGLTLGVHSRVDERVQYIRQRVHVGNVYVNRNMIGAMVGVQPFGGEGLSGTGPKAGGPHYLPRLCVERTYTVNTTATGGNASLLAQSGDCD